MRISALHVLREPPDADRHVRWCGSWGLEMVPGYPIHGRPLTLATVIGFRDIRRVPIENPSNNLYELRR